MLEKRFFQIVADAIINRQVPCYRAPTMRKTTLLIIVLTKPATSGITEADA